MIIFLIFLLLLGGCKTKETNKKLDKYEYVSKESLKQIIEKLNSTKDLLILSRDEINIKENNIKTNITYAIRNKFSKEICVYTQVRCIAVLHSSDCDSASFTKDSSYSWKWFDAPKSKIIKANSTLVLNAFINGDGKKDTFLARLIIWYNFPDEKGRCKFYSYNENEGLKQYAKKSLKITLDFEEK